MTVKALGVLAPKAYIEERLLKTASHCQQNVHILQLTSKGPIVIPTEEGA